MATKKKPTGSTIGTVGSATYPPYALNSKGVPSFTPYTAYTPPPLPTGSYDPALDAQEQQTQRGYQDTSDDTTLANSRALQDLGTASLGLKQQENDLDVNYGANVAALTKQYGDLATSQGEQDNAYGVLPGGGAALQAAAKRAANQQVAQTALDTQMRRALQPLQQQATQLGTDYSRGVTDRATALTRAGRENTQFAQDTTAEEAYQAAQGGYVAPARGQPGGIPSNEFIDSNGNARQIRTVNGVRYVYAPDGSIISQKKVKRT